MIKLSPRLLILTNYISIDDKVVDVGCDHALLGIYLTQNKMVNKIIGSDIIEHAIEKAKGTASQNGVNIDLRVGDGLKVLNEEDKIDTIVISGMGFFKIRKILEDYKTNLKNIQKIIIQLNTKEYDIRKYISSIGYYIKEESLIKENNIYYTNIVFLKGKERYTNKELTFGPYLLKNKDKTFYNYLEDSLKRNNILISLIPKKYFLLRLKKKREINKIKKELR